MGLGPILERRNVFQWDLAAAADADAPLDARCGYTLRIGEIPWKYEVCYKACTSMHFWLKLFRYKPQALFCELS